MRLMHNGIVEVEYVRPVEVSEFENYLPSDWFGPNSTIAMKKKCYGKSAMGSFTDFNVWDKELTLEQMRQFTQCKVRMEGNLIPWDINDWMVTSDVSPDEFRFETVNFKSLCSTKVIN